MKAGLKKVRVLCALSGGVDSSVAAALLVKEGYDVTGAYMVNYDDKKQKTKNKKQSNASCWLPDYRDAVRVAAKLNIPIIRLDFTKEYNEKVLNYMFKEYAAGRTPNPDVLCNKYIKFGVWLKKARDMGFDYLATGHYARVSRKSIKSKVYKVELLQAKDKNKDQTYFLHQLTQKQLQHVLFPVGGYLKSEVRSLARRFKLPTAEKEESMGICFVGEVPMKEFLETKIKHKPGKIIMSDGTIVGGHEGLAFYTIGQRHVGVHSSQFIANRDSRPLYVVEKSFVKNELVVGFEDDPLLYKKEIIVTEVNWVSGLPLKFPLQCEVRLRHRQPLQKAIIKTLEHKNIRTVIIKFNEPQRAITPGQFAVLYKKGDCLGGGVIS